MLRDIHQAVNASVVKSVWRSVLAGGVTPSAPKIPLDYLMLVGSSTTSETFTNSVLLGRQEQTTRREFTAAGLDIPVINKAVSGSTIADLDAAINGYMTSMATTGKAVGVIINIGSNDIEATSYADKGQSGRDAMVAGLTSIVNKVLAHGYIPILATVHSRESRSAMYEEWAELMYRPLITSLTPNYMAGNLAVFDYCRLYFNNQDVPNWWRDGVHPNLAAEPMRALTVAGVAAKFEVLAAPTQHEVICYFPNYTLPGPRLGGINAAVATSGATFPEVYTTRGELIAGATFTWAGATSGSNGTRPLPGDWGVSLSHSAIQNCSLYAGSGQTITFTAAFGAAYAGRTGTLRVTSNSNGVGRLTRITTPQGSVVINASAAGVQVVEVPFAMDIVGTLVFTALNEGASAYANVSGTELVFD